MPRRAVLTDTQRAELFALPENEADPVRCWTLNPKDLRIITSRRRPHNRLGSALQVCAQRYPGRLLKAGEFIPAAVSKLGMTLRDLRRSATRSTPPVEIDQGGSFVPTLLVNICPKPPSSASVGRLNLREPAIGLFVCLEDRTVRKTFQRPFDLHSGKHLGNDHGVPAHPHLAHDIR